MVICASFYLDYDSSKSAHSVRVGEKFLRSLRVILYMGSPQIFNFWGERKQQSPNDVSVIHCDLLAERESTTQTFLRLVVQHLLSEMHSLSIIPELYSGTFPQKSTFIKISLPLHLPNPPRVKDQGRNNRSSPLGEIRTKDEPRNTQRTPNHPKVLFIKIGYLKEIFVTVCIGYLPPLPNASVNFLYTPL